MKNTAMDLLMRQEIPQLDINYNIIGADYEDSQEDENYNDEYSKYDIGLSVDQIVSIQQNIAEFLSEDQLNCLYKEVSEGYKVDEQSLESKFTKIRDAMNMAMQVVSKKTFPWENASNVVFPLLSTAAMQYNARAMAALFGDVRNVCSAEIIGNDDGKPVIDPRTSQQLHIGDPDNPQPAWIIEPGTKKRIADRVSTYMNYQLGREETEFVEDMDAMFMAQPLTGIMFRKRWYDVLQNRNTSKNILPTNLIVNAAVTDLKKAPRISEKFELYKYEMTENVRLGLYLDIDYKKPSESIDTNEISEAVQTANDSESDVFNSVPYQMVEQYCRVDFDGDGYPEPYCIVYCKDVEKIVRIYPNYNIDTIIKDESGVVVSIEEEYEIVDYPFMKSPDGSIYGLGLGELLLPLNKSINTMINQMIDAGTLANTSGGFISRDLRIRGGKVSITPGQYNIVDNTGMALRDSIYERQSPEPSIVLFQLLGLVTEAAKELAGNKDILSGDQASQLAGVTTLSLIEQGLTAFKSIYQRVYRSFNRELSIQYKLNSRYLNQQKYINVLDDRQAYVVGDFSREDFSITPTAPMNEVTDSQKLARSQILMELKDDPFINPIEIRKRFLTSIGVKDIDMLVQAPPPAPVDPFVEIENKKADNDARKIDNDLVKISQDGTKLEAELRLADSEIQKNVAVVYETIAKAESLLAKTEYEILKADKIEGKDTDEVKDIMPALKDELEKVKTEFHSKLQTQVVSASEIHAGNLKDVLDKLTSAIISMNSQKPKNINITSQDGKISGSIN